MSQTTEPTQPTDDQPLARSASLLSLGNIASRILGLIREMVIAYYFGASGQVSAFRVASQVPTLIYDFLVGGMLSAALVPVLSEHASQDRRQEFLRLISALLTFFTLVLAGLVLLLELAAPTVAWLLASGLNDFDPELLTLTTRLIRLSTPAIWLFSMAGVFTAILYSLKRFTMPALATAIYNLGIVISAPLLAHWVGVTSLVFGILLGSLAQLLVMGFDLRRAGLRWQWQLDWSHPAIGKILRLYAPIAAGLVVTLFQIGLDRNLASRTGEQSIAWMANATTLQQMPLGIISVAISLAALPTLSQHFAAKDEAAYSQTLVRGLRMVLLLITPAAVGLWLLGTPVIRLLFERGDFTPQDTTQVAAALNIYLIGMLFAAIDFPLNYAFYARNNTLLPALVGVLSVVVYIVLAFALIEGLGYLGLVWADSAKQISHALVMLVLLGWRLGWLKNLLRRKESTSKFDSHSSDLAKGVTQILLSASIMACGIWAISWLIHDALPTNIFGDLIYLICAGGGGLLLYGLMLYWMRLPELNRLQR